MQVVSTINKRVWLSALATMVAVLTTGCGDACSEAQSLCEECSVENEDCEVTFADASQEFCEAAIETYEASCPEG